MVSESPLLSTGSRHFLDECSQRRLKEVSIATKNPPVSFRFPLSTWKTSQPTFLIIACERVSPTSKSSQLQTSPTPRSHETCHTQRAQPLSQTRANILVMPLHEVLLHTALLTTLSSCLPHERMWTAIIATATNLHREMGQH
jgi:hypothetical protein